MSKCYLAVDIEGGGSKLDDCILSIGFCYGNTKKYKKIRWSISTNINEIETKCYNEFWSKHEDILNIIQQESRPAEIVAKEIGEFLDSLEDIFSSVVVVCDNPAYDLTRLDYFLHKYNAREYPIHYGKNNEYRLVCNPVQIRRFFPRKEELFAVIKMSGAKHTHLPDDDAESLYIQQIFLEEPRKLDDLKRKMPQKMGQDEYFSTSKKIKLRGKNGEKIHYQEEKINYEY